MEPDMTRLTPTLAATLLAFGLLSTPALLRADNPPPSRLAVVNIVKVFASLDEKTKGDSELQALSTTLESEEKGKEKSIDDARTLLASLQPGGKPYQDAQDDLMRKTVDLQSYKSYIEVKLQMEQRLKTLTIYKLINDTIAQMSKERGIALVLVTDDPNFDDARSPAELTSRISIRKVLYADQSLDITVDVIKRINSAAQ
jgi:Skp family chaperone for outer membrane proteins